MVTQGTTVAGEIMGIREGHITIIFLAKTVLSCILNIYCYTIIKFNLIPHPRRVFMHQMEPITNHYSKSKFGNK